MVASQVELEVSPREVLGKKVKALRRQGVTPANVYGRGLESKAVQIPIHDLVRLLRAIDRTTIISLRVTGEDGPRPVVVHGVQRHPTTEELLHVDFFQVSLTEKIRLEVPIVLVGEAPAVGAYHGIVVQSLASVLVEALPTSMPAHIEADVSGLTEINDAIYVHDLKVPAGVQLHVDHDAMVVKVAAPAVAEAEAVAPTAFKKEEAGEAEGKGEKAT